MFFFLSLVQLGLSTKLLPSAMRCASPVVCSIAISMDSNAGFPMFMHSH
mgnify:CR=1 FL=1